ncbi:MAG: undecaprenyldiphospho-muramoylpentapeptide beta-N-acetylglucosaminyltransferase [Chitinophagaceae bacterium]|nr:MAG: undecaprenyldiphospho-muramoylpentapeptide beta-N-acetylglucosaminyltransferase [Chitinophagaceae bacterium]
MSKRIIIAGGGTGGHIFPALAIAQAIHKIKPDWEFLFVGAKGKMEMQKVPEAGFNIVGLDIVGFNRSSLLKNIGFPFKLIKSFWQVRKIFNEFKPDAVIGVGGYSTFPVLKLAQRKGIPSFIHESNSFAGKANILLGRNASLIFTGTKGMEKFFPSEKIVVTGNPIRKNIVNTSIIKKEALNYFDLLDEAKPTLLVVGGSLGAKSINEAIHADLQKLIKAGIQVIWQTGKSFVRSAATDAVENKSVWVGEFISRMDYAYAAADVVMARAGAMTVAEICALQKPTVFVPYPFAAEDHQTENAKNLVAQNAALMVADKDVKERGVDVVINLSQQPEMMQAMKQNLMALSILNADDIIAQKIIENIHAK